MMRRIHASALVALLVIAACAHLSDDEQRVLEQRRQLADRYLQTGETELAIREMRGILEVHEPYPQVHFSLGEAYRRKQEYALSEHHLRRALELDPELLDARLNLGVVFLEQERWADAIAVTEPLASDPTFLNPARALVNLGWAHYKLGELDQAEKQFRKALESNRSHFQAYLNLGIVLYDKNQLAEALAQFEKALELLAGRPPELFATVQAQAGFRAAMAHMRLGQRDEAIEQLRAAAERGGDSEWGRKSREYLAVLQ